MLRFVSEADRELALRMAQKALVFSNALRHNGKQRVMQPRVRRLEAELRTAFKEQGEVYLRIIGEYESEWPVTVNSERRNPAKASNPGRLTGMAREMKRVEWREAMEWGTLDDALSDGDEEVEELFVNPIVRTVLFMLEAGAEGLAREVQESITFDIKHPRAQAYIQAHGAELVKQINQATHEQMKVILDYGLENGWSYKKTAAAIQEQFKDYYTGNNWWNFDAARPQLHIDSRAHLIAVTEAGQAYEEGSYLAAEELAEAGIELEKSWSTMGDDRVSEGCQENGDEGWIPYNQAHRSGDMHPLRFPGCRCDELYQRIGA